MMSFEEGVEHFNQMLRDPMNRTDDLVAFHAVLQKVCDLDGRLQSVCEINDLWDGS